MTEDNLTLDGRQAMQYTISMCHRNVHLKISAIGGSMENPDLLVSIDRTITWYNHFGNYLIYLLMLHMLTTHGLTFLIEIEIFIYKYKKYTNIYAPLIKLTQK